MIDYNDELNKITKRLNTNKINEDQAEFDLIKLNAYSARNGDDWYSDIYLRGSDIHQEDIENDAENLITDWNNNRIPTHDFYRECDKILALCEQEHIKPPFEQEFIDNLVKHSISLLIEDDDLYNELGDDDAEDEFGEEEEEGEGEVVYTAEIGGHTLELYEAGSGSVYLMIDGELTDNTTPPLNVTLEILASLNTKMLQTLIKACETQNGSNYFGKRPELKSMIMHVIKDRIQELNSNIQRLGEKLNNSHSIDSNLARQLRPEIQNIVRQDMMENQEELRELTSLKRSDDLISQLLNLSPRTQEIISRTISTEYQYLLSHIHENDLDEYSFDG